jgi:GTP-binding protein
MKQLPEPLLPEFAMLGRSNVGKSSFINSLLQRKLAHTSNTPGKTRLMNFYVIRAELRERPLEFSLVDLPGYGYAKMAKTERAHWGDVMQKFLMKRPNLCRVVHLIDIRHGMLENALEMHHWLIEEGFPVWVVLTKSDKLSRSQAASQILDVKKALVPTVDQIFSYSTTTPSISGHLGGFPAGREALLEHVAEQVWNTPKFEPELVDPSIE